MTGERASSLSGRARGREGDLWDSNERNTKTKLKRGRQGKKVV